MSEQAGQIIDELGGAAAISRATKYTDGAVRQWKFKNRIPRNAWPDLVDAFPAISLERLRATEAA